MIINQIALIVNNMVISLYSNGIHFYQIIIGLFIFNLIVYYIVKLIKEGRRTIYFK